MNQPTYVFIAIGIGITPFRSIIKNLIDTKKKEHILLLYQANRDEFLFQDVFEQAEKEIGLETIYLSKEQTITEEFIKQHINNLTQPTYYLSGPQHTVEKLRDMMLENDIDTDHIKTDLFSGYE